MKKVFVADNNFNHLLLMNSWFKKKGCYTRTFSAAKYLFDALEELLPDLIVMDEKLCEEDGREICNEIKRLYRGKVSVILVSENPEHLKKENNRADNVLQKPLASHQFSHLINSCVGNMN